MTATEAMNSAKRVLNVIASGSKPSVQDIRAIRVAERCGYITLTDNTGYVLTSSGRRLVGSARTHNIF